MMPDLTKLVLHTAYPAFLNNNVYTGTVTLSGDVSEGLNTFNFTVPLDEEPDLVDVMFEGESTGIGRPAGAWFKEGFVDATAPGTTHTAWITSKIDGTDLIITATIPKQTSGTDTLDGTDVGYRLVDYSTTTDRGFDSRFNYLKRGETGTTSLTLPSAGTIVTHEVDHDLGYVPFYIVGAEIADGSIIWSNNYVHPATASDTAGGGEPPQLRYWCEDDTLTIKLANGFAGQEQTGTRDVYWAVYLDYENA